MTPEQLEAHRAMFEVTYEKHSKWTKQELIQLRQGQGYSDGLTHSMWCAYCWALTDVDPAQRAEQPPQQSAQPDVPETDCGNIAQPVAEVVQMNQSRYFSCIATSETTIPQIGAKLYAAAQPVEVQPVPLTEDQIYEVIRPLCDSDEGCQEIVNISLDEYRAIEAAHGIGPTSSEGVRDADR